MRGREAEHRGGGATGLSQALGSPRETPVNPEVPGAKGSWKSWKEGLQLSRVMERTPRKTESSEAQIEAYKINCSCLEGVCKPDNTPRPGPPFWGHQSSHGKWQDSYHLLERCVARASVSRTLEMVGCFPAALSHVVAAGHM